jgi:hypothetical protein
MSKQPAIRHTYYVVPTVRATEDWQTKKVTVTGMLGIAPDDHTIIEYPVHIWEFGYWNKGNVRKVAAQVKRRLLAECREIGYEAKDFTKPVEVSLFWER